LTVRWSACSSTISKGTSLDANQAALDLLGYRREDIATLTFESVLTEDQLPMAHQTVEEVRATGRHQRRGEHRLRRKDGGVVFVETQSSLIYREGKPFAIQGIARDVTGRKRAEEENARLQAQLHHAQRMESIGRLAGGVAHDLNNLLTVINGYSRLLLGKLKAGDPLLDGLEQIHRAGERAAGLTQQLLAFSRKQVLQPRALDLNRVVGEMRPMLERLMGRGCGGVRRVARGSHDHPRRSESIGSGGHEPGGERQGRHARGRQVVDRDGRRGVG